MVRWEDIQGIERETGDNEYVRKLASASTISQVSWNEARTMVKKTKRYEGGGEGVATWEK